MSRFRRMFPALKAALPLLILAGLLREARALAISWNADDLRGVWVMTCPVFNAATGASLGEFYVQFSMGGAATANNTTLGVLGGGTYQENSTRTITGGNLVISATGSVTCSPVTGLSWVDSNANIGGLPGVPVGGISPFATVAGTMGQDKNTITGARGTDGAYTGANIGNFARQVTLTKISDEEVRDGNSAGQACFLGAARR